MTHPAAPRAGRPRDVSGALVAAACVAALVLRVAFGALAARHVGGDQWWYVEAGKLIREHGAVAYPCADLRPPGMPWLLAGLDLVSEGHAAALARVVAAVAWAASCWSVAALVRRMVPGARHAPWAAAWLLALDPVTVEMSSRVLAENLATPLVLAGTVVALRLFDAPSLGRAAGVGLLWCAARLFRPDVLVEGGALAVVAGGLLLRRRELWSLRAAACATAAAVAIIGTLAWRAGCASVEAPVFPHFTELADYPRTHVGIHAWLRTVDLPRTDHLDLIYNGPGRYDPARIPASAFDDPAEAEEVRSAYAIDADDEAASPPTRGSDASGGSGGNGTGSARWW
jgi:hypothetical protein